MKLGKGFHVVALLLQEAATTLSHDNIRQRLHDSIREHYQGSGQWCYLVDVFGDDESGYCVYSCDGELLKADYTISSANGKAVTVVDCDSAVDVVPRTSYEEEADDEDGYTAMAEAKLYSAGELPAVERFVSKDERAEAPSGSFAGKGKSFPILKPGDVMAAVRSIGRAGSENYDAGTLKRNIIRIAKAKGWSKYLPKAWRGGDSKEASAPAQKTADGLRLCESACEFAEAVQVREARTDYEVKLISPGKGSTAYYTREALEASGPKVFTRGTHMYWNHPTRTEESERPERDLNDLAAVLTTDAKFQEKGAKGPGLYARAKVFADYAERVEDKANHIGLSILASGLAEMGRDGKPVMKEGVPVLKEFTVAQSTDFVTRAGAGGMVLTESAPADNPTQEASMDAAELKKLQEQMAALSAENRKIRERLAVAEAGRQVELILGGLRISEAIAQRVKGRVLAGVIPLTEAGDIDAAKLKSLVEAEAKDECDYIARLSEGRIVTGMGTAAAEATPEQRAQQQKDLDAEASAFAAGLGFRSKEAQAVMTRGRDAFDPSFNALEVTGD